MRPLVWLTLATCGFAAALAADAPAGVQYKKPADVDAMRASGDTGGILIADPDFKVLAGRRDKPGQAEVHAVDTDIFIVIDGRATIMLGGTVVDGKETAPGEIRGSAIKDGTDYLLEKGTVLTIPRGTPHWVRETQPGFHYFVVKSVAHK
jgi:mannose-6-phosphate isomerase-like protein (cupin superfamily)